MFSLLSLFISENIRLDVGFFKIIFTLYITFLEKFDFWENKQTVHLFY